MSEWNCSKSWIWLYSFSVISAWALCEWPIFARQTVRLSWQTHPVWLTILCNAVNTSGDKLLHSLSKRNKHYITTDHGFTRCLTSTTSLACHITVSWLLGFVVGGHRSTSFTRFTGLPKNHSGNCCWARSLITTWHIRHTRWKPEFVTWQTEHQLCLGAYYTVLLSTRCGHGLVGRPSHLGIMAWFASKIVVQRSKNVHRQ